MHIKTLTLKDYRNYSSAHINLNSGMNVLVGQNAQGKTNLLECVHFLSTGRSHRTSNAYELIRWGSAGFFLQAEVAKRNYEVRMDIQVNSDKTRDVRINSIPHKKMSAILGTVNSVMFAPEDLQLVKGSPAMRRRFLDIELSQVNAIYLNALQQYTRILSQKNMLLKSATKGLYDREAISAWNDQMVQYGSKIIAMRRRAIDYLEHHAAECLSQLTNQQEKLTVVYKPWGKTMTCPDDETTVANHYREILKKAENDERRRRTALVGPHRDDFVCLVNGTDLKNYGSQGQQRSCALALKLAEMEFMKQVTNDYPVLLLDDVLSELDERRRAALLSQVDRGVQTLITGTEAGMFTGLPSKSALVAEIRNGIISLVS